MHRIYKQFFVYILHCSDGSYYVGHTEDLEQRLEDHIDGRGAVWTAARRPIRLVYQESFPELRSAIRREIQIKKWSRAKKDALIGGDIKKLKQLSKKM